MGASDSKEAAFQDEITRVISFKGPDGVGFSDPLIQQLQALKTITPILRVPSNSESNLQDVVLCQTSGQGRLEIDSLRLDPQSTLEMFSVYEEWCRANAAKAGRNQGEIHDKIDLVEALAVKLLQRLNHSVGVMKASAEHLQEVRTLQAEVVDMKAELTSVLKSYEHMRATLESQGYFQPPLVKQSSTQRDNGGEGGEKPVTNVLP